MKRDAWTANFSEIVACVYNDVCPLPTPVVIPDPTPDPIERPRIIRDPSNLVPDVNLRAAIAESLGKTLWCFTEDGGFSAIDATRR